LEPRGTRLPDLNTTERLQRRPRQSRRSTSIFIPRQMCCGGGSLRLHGCVTIESALVQLHLATILTKIHFWSPCSEIEGAAAAPMSNRYSNGKGGPTLQFSLGATFAISACAVGGLLNAAAGSPLAPPAILEIISTIVCIVALAISARTSGNHLVTRFAGVLSGLALAVLTTVVSQSNDLASGMFLQPPRAALGPVTSEILYGEPRPVTPIPLHPHPRSFLSRTHEPATLRLAR
jgi:hypothetical protein